MPPQRHTIGIVGTGTMGSGIAQAAAQAGYSVVFQNRREASVTQAVKRIRQGLERLVAKEKLGKVECEETMDRIRPVVPLEELKGCERIIECTPEELELKRELLQRIDAIVGDESIIATNTSSLSVTKLASYLRRPGHFVGLHFFNPVPLMTLVELIRGQATSPESMQIATDLCKTLGKTPVEAADYPGFIANRILMPMINEAIYAVMEGVGTPEAIDTVMKLGMNHPMGPLTLADFIGLDVCLAILNVLHEGLGDPKYRPCPLLRRMVAAGQLGRKSGRGFYTY